MKTAVVFVSATLIVSALAEDCDESRRLASTRDVQAILLDDGEADGAGWHHGTYAPCLQDAYGGMFHHDWARDKGKVSAEYGFDPPKDGCYVVEEYHPGKSRECSQYLPNNARVDVDFCKGKSTYTYVDQSQGGGRWTVLGALPFFVGWRGRIKVSNNGTSTTCALGRGCFWVADAFRVTWVSEVLSSGCKVPHAMVETTAQTPAPTSSTSSNTAVGSESMTATESHSGDVKSATQAENLALNPVQALAALQTVVDDIGLNFSSPWQMYRSLRGNTLKCGIQGWKQSFLYLDPSHGADAGTAIEFPFDPPEDGCYLLEEFHPENHCDVPFSSETALTVHYCKGLKTFVEIDQTKNGNQWTTVGLMPFYKGFPGKVLISHPQVGSGLAVADALRFTRVSKSCDDAETKAFQYVRLAQNAPAVIADSDQLAEAYAPAQHTCGHGAIGGGFHAASKGVAEARFEFHPASTGCYRIDSYHPENDQAEQCTLLENTTLDINWCLGKHTKVGIPLRGNGNQWNTVGHFKYYAGAKGSVISRRARESIEGKYWVADAVRFTKVAASCDMIPDVGLITLHITSPELENLDAATLDAGLMSYPDMRIALHEAIVEATQLSHDSVQLLSIRKGSIIADFEVRGSMALVDKSLSDIRSQIMDRTESKLKQLLCRAVAPNSKTTCKVTLTQMIAVPAPRGTEEEAKKEEETPWSSTLHHHVVIMVSCFLAIIMSSALIILLRRWMRRVNTASTTWQDQVVPIGEMEDGQKQVGSLAKTKDTIRPIDELKKAPDTDEVSVVESTITPNSLNDVDDIDIQSVASDAKAAEIV